MDDKIIDCITKAVIKTFEEMAFIDAVYIGNEKQEINVSHLLSVDIIEPIKGCIVLFMPLECKKKLAENIYSKDFNLLSSEEIDDCQLELLNIIAGNFLFFYFGNSKYKLDLPHIIFNENELDFNNKYELFFAAEEVIFKVFLAI